MYLCFTANNKLQISHMYQVLSKNTIILEILPYLSVAKRGFTCKADITEVINGILYKLKTGIQWHMLPVKSLFSDVVLSYKTLFYHFRKWCKNGEWKYMWTNLLKKYRSKLDMSSVDLDGSHTRAVKGGESVGYQGRKKSKTTNALYLTDRQGLPLAMSVPVSGEHNDLYRIKRSTDEIFGTLEEAGISVDGLFLNADAGFDSEDFRNQCFSHGVFPNVCFNKRNGGYDRNELLINELYRKRYIIERTNAWMDSFRSVLVRHDTALTSWEAWNYIVFVVLLLRKC